MKASPGKRRNSPERAGAEKQARGWEEKPPGEQTNKKSFRDNPCGRAFIVTGAICIAALFGGAGRDRGYERLTIETSTFTIFSRAETGISSFRLWKL